MYIKIGSIGFQSAPSISLRCPHCRHQGIFESPLDNELSFDKLRMGMRICPNRACRGLVFTVVDVLRGKVEASYPAERIDFDSTNIPAGVLSAIEEAITCQSCQCHVAAAIMVRKALELICHDRGASGSNLKERLKQLGEKVIMPPALLAGLDALRLLGNDAAHIDSDVYMSIGEVEVGLAIDVVKEVLKATYQYEDLLKRLHALKLSSA